jgi:hypothetical protein
MPPDAMYYEDLLNMLKAEENYYVKIHRTINYYIFVNGIIMIKL